MPNNNVSEVPYIDFKIPNTNVEESLQGQARVIFGALLSPFV